MDDIDLKPLVKKINRLSPDISPAFLATFLKPEIEQIAKQVRHNELQSNAVDADYFVSPNKLLLLKEYGIADHT